MSSSNSPSWDIEKDKTLSTTGNSQKMALDSKDLPINWPSSKKWKNVLAVASMTLLTPFASSMFAPAIDQVMDEMHCKDRELGSFIVSVYLLGYAFGPLFLAPSSELFGRLPVYHICSALFIITNVACALSINVPMLIVFRFLTGLVGAGPLTIGPGTISDCFKKEQQGLAMAVWTMPVLLGPCLGPAVGAYVSRSLGWRWDFWLLIMMTGAVYIICLVVQDETHPSTLLKRQLARSGLEIDGEPKRAAISPGRAFFKSITRPTKLLFFSPIVFGLFIITAFAYGTLYLLFTTVSDVFRTRYGIVTNVGLVFLGFGIGQLVGLSIFAVTSDRIMVRMTKRNNNISKSEFRLPPMVLGGAMVPIGLLIYGWSAQYRVFWFVPIIGTFLIGFGMITIFTPVGTYLVDAFPEYAASATAANTVFRSIGGGLLPLAGDKMYQTLDQGWGNTLLAGISLVCLAMILLAIRYGEMVRTHPRFQVNLS